MESDPDYLMKDSLATTGQILEAQGYAPATSSNYSCRQPGSDVIWISASGLNKAYLGVGDLIAIDRKGNKIDDNPKKTSAETLLHTLLYDLFPEVNCVLHSHSIFNTVLSRAHEAEGEIVLEGYEVQKALPGITTHESKVRIPIFPNSQNIPELAAKIRTYLKAQPDTLAYLISGHGLYTWGKNIDATQISIEALEFLLRVFYHYKMYTQ